MLRNPTVHRADLTVGEARAAFEASAKQRLLLLVADGRLVSTVSRDDLAGAYDGARRAAEVGTLDGRTVTPDVPLEEVMTHMESRGLRRIAVVEADLQLVGLLCLKRSLTGFCTDEGVAEMRRDRAAVAAGHDGSDASR